MQNKDGMEYTRAGMIRSLAEKGISGLALEVMSEIPRHLFVSEALRYSAYRDASLPIGFGQTISKPSVIAKMVHSLNLTGEERVLEIGTGSGYQTAVLARLTAAVVSMERIESLARRAAAVLQSLRIVNVTVLNTDDFNKTNGTFDAIVVAAGADIFPVDLFAKLNVGGRLVIPIGSEEGHSIMRYTKRNDGNFIEEHIGQAKFVPYITAAG